LTSPDVTVEESQAMSRWQDKVAYQVAFIAPAVLLVFMGIQDIALMPPDKTDTVGGVLWIVAGLLLLCLGVAWNYGRRTLVFLALALSVVSGIVAVVWTIYRLSLTIEEGQSMSGWLANPLVVMCFVAILFLFFGLQDLLFVPPDRRDAVSGVLWIAASISAGCLGVVQQQHGYRTPALLLFILLLATGMVAHVWKIIGLVRSGGA
jgi:hypothetical protein